LRAEATRSGRPATILAREAIEAWIRERKREREQVSDRIAEYATEVAGTEGDIDRTLERAGTDHLLAGAVLRRSRSPRARPGCGRKASSSATR
jgi:hypothetical protein